jgi:MFS family permease
VASLGLLRERPFALLFLARTLSTAGDALIPVAIAFAVLDVAGPAALGLVLGAQWGARVVFLLLGGVWADRLPRQSVMMAADLLRGGVQAIVAIGFFVDSISLWQLAVAQALLGAGSAFFNPASTALVPQVVAGERLQEAHALLGLTRSATQVIGPAVAGIVVSRFGFGVIFLLDALTYAASLVFVAAMRLPRLKAATHASVLTDALDGLRAVRAQRWLVSTLMCDFVFNVALAAYFVLGAVVMKEHFDGPESWGLVLAAASAGAIVGGGIALRLRPSRPLLVGYLLGLATPLELLLLSGPAPVPALMLGAATMFASLTLYNTFHTATVQRRVEPQYLSRVDSLTWLASLVGMPAAMAVVGPLAVLVGTRPTLIGASVLGVAAIATALSVREVRDLRTDARPRAAAPLRQLDDPA